MEIKYKKLNDPTIYTENNVFFLYVGQSEDGYFLNYMSRMIIKTRLYVL